MICSFCYCVRNESYGLNYSLEYSTMVFYWLHLDFFFLAEIRQCMMIIIVYKILNLINKNQGNFAQYVFLEHISYL